MRRATTPITQCCHAGGVGAAQPPECFVVSGVGEFLARRLVGELWPADRVVSLSENMGLDVSACAPAHALAVLAREAVGE